MHPDDNCCIRYHWQRYHAEKVFGPWGTTLDALKSISLGCKNFMTLYCGKIYELKLAVSCTKNNVPFLKLLSQDIFFSVYILYFCPFIRTILTDYFRTIKHDPNSERIEKRNTGFTCVLFQRKNIANAKSLARKLHVKINMCCYLNRQMHF